MLDFFLLMRQGRVETPPSAHSPLQKRNFQQNKQQIFSELAYCEMPGNSLINIFRLIINALRAHFPEWFCFLWTTPPIFETKHPLSRTENPSNPSSTHDLFHQNHTPTDNEKTAIFGVGEGEIMPKNDLSEVATGGDGTKKWTKSLAL